MNILQQGTHPTFGAFLHALLPQIEEGVTTFLTRNLNNGNEKVMIHRILQTGEIVSQEMNIPFVRAVLQAVDTAIQ